MSVPAAEVPYMAEDLNVLKPVLITFVERQVGKWPGSFRPSKATVSDIRKVLLAPQHGFTKPCTTEPPKRATSPLSLTPEPPSKDIGEHSASNHFIDFITSKWVKLLIKDARALPEPTKISQEVNLWIVDKNFCKLDEWRVELLDLIQELQKSHAALKESGPDQLERKRICEPREPRSQIHNHILSGKGVDKTRTSQAKPHRKRGTPSPPHLKGIPSTPSEWHGSEKLRRTLREPGQFATTHSPIPSRALAMYVVRWESRFGGAARAGNEAFSYSRSSRCPGGASTEERAGASAASWALVHSNGASTEWGHIMSSDQDRQSVTDYRRSAFIVYGIYIAPSRLSRVYFPVTARTRSLRHKPEPSLF
ncbi:hypothetical protein DFH06DRAFT_1303247 [Mycena polygramma]|nr:hypothetical protein DFH06DRAFT_1303247 [Mycena polygramma]